MKETDLTEPGTEQAFGNLISSFRAKPNLVLIVIFLFFALVLSASGAGLMSEKAYLTGFVCVTFSLPCFWLVWLQFSLGRDELRIYQNGLTYKGRGKVQTCMWQDMRSLTFLTGRSNTTTISVSSALQSSRGTLVAIRKNSGELIELNEELKCEAEMIDAIKAFRKSERTGAMQTETDE